MQTRLQSFIETVINIGLGFVVALLAQLVIFPIMGIHTSWKDDLIIVSLFTIVSVIRSYYVRRLFNWLHS